MIPMMSNHHHSSEQYHETRCPTEVQDGAILPRSSSTQKRQLSSGNIRPKKKKQRTVIAIGGIQTVAPPESSSNSMKQQPLHPSKEDRAGEENIDMDISEESSSSSDDDSSTSSQDTVPPLPADTMSQSRDLGDDDWAVKRLDENSIRLGEKHMMDKLDGAICREEEQEIMEYIFKTVCKAEDLSHIRSLPSVVKHEDGGYRWKVKTIEEGGQMPSNDIIPDSWKPRKRRRRLRRLSRSLGHNNKSWVTIGNTFSGSPSSNDDKEMSKVEDVQQGECKIVRQSLPKWITLPLPIDDRVRLFTRSQFVRHVIVETEKEIPSNICNNACLWNVSISESHPEFPDSFLLEARAPADCLDKLREKTSQFVRGCIFKHNREALLGDHESLLVDVSVSLTKSGSLGISLARYQDVDDQSSGIGIMVTRVNPETEFCRLLGGNAAYGDGCVLLAIDDTVIKTAQAAIQLIQKSKETEMQKEKEGQSPISKITMCFSRYASFLNSTDQSAMTIRTVEGERVELDEVGEYRLQRYFERAGSPPRCWVEEDEDEAISFQSSEKDGPGTKQEVAEAFLDIVRDQRSVEVEVVLSARDGEIGAKIDEISGKGLFLRRINSNKQLGKILGEHASHRGAILWKVNRGIVGTKAEMDDSIESVGLSCYKIDFIDRLARGSINPRRRNGQPYSLCKRNFRKAKRKSEAKRKFEENGEGVQDNLEDSDEEGVETGTSSRAICKTPLERFLEFESKFKRLVRLDYKDTKIHIKHILSSLWAKHKALFGENIRCDESCRCIHSLPELETSILDDYLTRQRKNKKPTEPRSSLESRVPGIMKHFSPRFIPKLCDAYKEETPQQLVERLCDMWAFHTRTRQYGVRCGASCLCEEEWEQLFGQGDTRQAEIFWSSSCSVKKRTPSLDTSTAGVPHSSTVIPRKKRLVGHESLESRSDVPLVRLSGPNPRRTSLNLAPKRNSTVVTYEVAFDSSIPLGGYFKTNSTTNGLTFVEVESVSPVGQMVRDRRIATGTCVQAVLTGENRNSVVTHEELKERYDTARRHRRPLKLILVNQESLLARSHGQQSWDSNGDWTGTDVDGWAGGAVDRNQREKAPPVERREIPSVAQSQQQNEQEMWVIKVHNNLLPDLSSNRPGKSCLKQDATNSGSKKVRFTKSGEKRVIFDKKYPSNTEVVRQCAEVIDACIRESPKISQEQRLSDAIRNGSCKNVVAILQSDFVMDADLVKRVLKSQYDEIKKEMALLDAIGSLEGGKKKDFDAKCTVLKVYINCSYQIEKAMSLTKWYRLQFRVVQINITKASSSTESFGRTCVGRVVMRHGKGDSSKEILGSLPVKSLSGSISYETHGQPPFVANNNATFGMEDRELVIEVKEGYDGEIMPARSIGSVAFEMDELEKNCPLGDTWVDFVRPIRSEDSAVIRGEARISVMKQHVGSDYATQKRAEILQALKVQMDSIKKYNADPDRNPDEKLSGNIQGINGLSLLHAAIHLGESGLLISAMLDLGVDPRLKSPLGTPLHFAQQQLDRALEKEKNLEAKQAPVDDLVRQRAKRKQVKEMVDLLLKATPSYDEDLAAGDCGKASSSSYDRDCEVVSGARETLGTTEGRHHTREKVAHSEEGDIRKRPKNKKSSTAISPRRPSLSLPCGNRGSDASSGNSEKRLAFTPILPNLPSVDWAPILNKKDRRCTNNLRGCFHFRTNSCHFWHDVLSPLRPEEMILTPRHGSPRLPPNRVALKEERHMWTAVYADTALKRFIHVQDVFQKGFTSRQGISWFTNRGDAEAALERTVAVLFDVEGPSPPPRKHNKNYSNNGKLGRRGS